MSSLPPQPDLHTGEPAPPEAPRTAIGNMGGEEYPYRLPKAPEGEGPTLAYYRESNKTVWLSASVVPIFILLASIAYGGLIVLTYWFIWAIMGVIFAIVVYQGRSEILTAGVEWLRFGTYWVRTYELTRMDCLPAANGARQDIAFNDAHRSVVIPIKTLQADKKLWNYVHLGLRHSVANGAEITRSVRSQFPELTADTRRETDT